MEEWKTIIYFDNKTKLKLNHIHIHKHKIQKPYNRPRALSLPNYINIRTIFLKLPK